MWNAERHDAVDCGFYIYDFPLNYDNAYERGYECGEEILFYSNGTAGIYDYTNDRYMHYIVE